MAHMEDPSHMGQDTPVMAMVATGNIITALLLLISDIDCVQERHY